MPAAYFLYARKSTEEEDRQVLSIDAQLHELRTYAQREGLTVTEEFIEAKTAKQPGRPVFDLMLKQVEDEKAQGLLAWHPSWSPGCARYASTSAEGGKENPAAAKHLLKTVGSNFTLNHRRLCVTYGLPFELVAQTDPRNDWLPD